VNLVTKLQKARAERDAYKDALSAALLAIHDLKVREGAAEESGHLQKLLTGYPPASHTAMVYVEPGHAVHGPAYVIVRRVGAVKK